MRRLITALAAGFVLTAAGCGSSDKPVTVTPEMEAEQKANQDRADQEEKAEIKNRRKK